MVAIELAPGVGERHDAGARRDEVGLGDEVDGRRTARAVRRDLVVPAGQRPLGAVGADGEHPRRVARRRDAAVLRLLRGPTVRWPRLPAAATTTMPASTARLAASVSGSVSYDSVTRAPTERLMTRMLCATRLATAHSKAAMTSLMTPAPCLVEHLQADDVRRRRDAGVRAVGVVAVAGDDPRDVRAVPVVVVGVRQSVDEVHERASTRWPLTTRTALDVPW